MGKSDEKSFGQNVCDIGRVELGLKHSSSDCGAVEESAEAEQDPWALTDLVDTSEKWSGNSMCKCIHYEDHTARP